MKNIIQLKDSLLGIKFFGLSLIALTFLGCEKELPEAGSLTDDTPPEASFSFAQLSSDNYLEVTFTNASTSATDYIWNFGDGTTSTEAEPVHEYTAEGTYTVTLTASDKLGANSELTQDITLTEPSAFIPPIIEASFEDGALPDGTGDGRDSWRNSDLGGVIQITSDPVRTGSQAAKLTGDPGDARIGYQLLTVTANTVYDVTFYYTMKTSPTGWITVSVLDGPVTSHAEALAGTIGTVTVNDQTDADTYVKGTVTFNSGNNTEVAIYFFNDGSVESRLDDFGIDISSGTVPPSAAFTYQADSTDYQKINFTNTSINSTSYSWDFGDGSTSTDTDPSHTYTSDGTYAVTLTATSGTEMSTATTDVVIKAPSNVVIQNPSFDDSAVRDDNRIEWRNTALEADAVTVFGNSSYVLQTSTTARTGSFAGKLPTMENSSDPRRWLYQAITVNPNTNYTISGWIRNKDANVGSTVTFAIYDAPFSTAATIGNASSIIHSEDYNAATGHDTDTWTEATINFNSGSSTEVVLFITNDYTLNGDPTTEESESFFDDFSIVEQ